MKFACFVATMLKIYLLTLKNNSGYLMENFFNSRETGCRLLNIGMQMESTFVNKFRNRTWGDKKKGACFVWNSVIS